MIGEPRVMRQARHHWRRSNGLVRPNYSSRPTKGVSAGVRRPSDVLTARATPSNRTNTDTPLRSRGGTVSAITDSNRELRLA